MFVFYFISVLGYLLLDRVVSKLGQGTYGTVVKVEDAKTKKMYALKEFQNDKTVAREMLGIYFEIAVEIFFL
jgi:serine/threonine protein kinase